MRQRIRSSEPRHAVDTRPRCWLGVFCFRQVNTNPWVSLLPHQGQSAAKRGARTTSLVRLTGFQLTAAVVNDPRAGTRRQPLRGGGGRALVIGDFRRWCCGTLCVLDSEYRSCGFGASRMQHALIVLCCEPGVQAPRTWPHADLYPVRHRYLGPWRFTAFGTSWARYPWTSSFKACHHWSKLCTFVACPYAFETETP